MISKLKYKIIETKKIKVFKSFCVNAQNSWSENEKTMKNCFMLSQFSKVRTKI